MDDPNSDNTQSKSYALSGKIMLCSVAVLFTVVILMLILHIYIRWQLMRRNRRRRQQRRALEFAANTTAPNARRGLDPAILKSIPVFVCKPEVAVDVDCAVCLCEFEENEKGRTLPGCLHSFHVDCIDMWFSSNSTCPLCRAAVVPVQSESTQLVSSSSTSSSGSSSSSSNEGGEMRIEVPERRVVEEFKSPGGRMLSFRRMLTFNLGGGGSGDIERGEVVGAERPAGMLQ